MERNVAGQVIDLCAIVSATGAFATGDAANLTFYVAIGTGSPVALTDTSAAEISATNAKGMYRCTLTQAETNGAYLLFSGKSATAGIEVVSDPQHTTPAGFSLDVVQTGDSFARIGLAGVGLTNVVLPAGGLANVTAWTVAITGNVTGNLSGSVGSVTGAVGSVTGAVGSVTGAVGSVTAAITLPPIPASWITAAGIADGSIDTATFAAGTTIPRCTLTDIVTTYTGNTPQTGDSYARIGLTGSGLTSIEGMILEAIATDHNDPGSIGALINASAPVGAAMNLAAGAVNNAAFAADTGLKTITSGTLVSATASTAVLPTGSITTDEYKTCWFITTGGQGQGQARLITGYNGTTKTVTVAPNFTTGLDNTTTYVIRPFTAVALAVGSVTDVQTGLATAATLTTVLADTNELQVDWVNGGRLDLLIDAIIARLPAALSSNGNLKADVREVNNVPLRGTGVNGDEWGPA